MGLLVILGIFAIVLIWVISVYNGLILSRNRVRNSFSQIDVQIKQRFDMMPNLIEIVKGYVVHEKDTLREIVEARNHYHNADSLEKKAEVENIFSQSLGKLFALSESYPELKANTNFLELQRQLEKTEEQIRFSRQFFNDTVQKYNDKLLIFPVNMIAGLLGFQEETYFQITQNERENIKISF